MRRRGRRRWRLRGRKVDLAGAVDGARRNRLLVAFGDRVGSGRAASQNRVDGVNELRRLCGYAAVSPDYGLAYASGVDLERVYVEYGYVVQRQVVSWPELAYLCEIGIGQLGGARLYHWMGVRGYDGRQFNLANPAYSWKGIGDDLDAAEWNAWGQWNAVMVVGVQ